MTVRLPKETVFKLTASEVANAKAKGFYTWKLNYVLGRDWYAVLPKLFFGNVMNTGRFPGSELEPNVAASFKKDTTSPSGVRSCIPLLCLTSAHVYTRCCCVL
jgi:hypothetical protein